MSFEELSSEAEAQDSDDSTERKAHEIDAADMQQIIDNTGVGTAVAELEDDEPYEVTGFAD